MRRERLPQRGVERFEGGGPRRQVPVAELVQAFLWQCERRPFDPVRGLRACQVREQGLMSPRFPVQLRAGPLCAHCSRSTQFRPRQRPCQGEQRPPRPSAGVLTASLRLPVEDGALGWRQSNAKDVVPDFACRFLRSSHVLIVATESENYKLLSYIFLVFVGTIIGAIGAIPDGKTKPPQSLQATAGADTPGGLRQSAA